MKSVIPETFSSCDCKRRITSLALILRSAKRLQIDQNSTAVQCRVGSVDTDKRRKALNRGILQNDLASACCRFAMSENETDCAPPKHPGLHLCPEWERSLWGF